MNLNNRIINVIITLLTCVSVVMSCTLNVDATTIERNNLEFSIIECDEEFVNVIFTSNTYRIDSDCYYTYDTYNGYDVFYINLNGARCKLIPTGKCRENTEVCIGTNYYIINETNIIGHDVIGDINYDGISNVADLVMLHSFRLSLKPKYQNCVRHIVGKQNLFTIASHRADLNRDGITDSIDLSCMRLRMIK